MKAFFYFLFVIFSSILTFECCANPIKFLEMENLLIRGFKNARTILKSDSSEGEEKSPGEDLIKFMNNFEIFHKKMDEYVKEHGLDKTQLVGLPQFNCPILKSPKPPTSVHKLMPGDVDVVAALGDSLTAANGAKALTLIGLLTQYRGVAWSIGGDETLDSITTLPNFLKKFNPNIYGFSIKTGMTGTANCRLNMAKPGARSPAIKGQAEDLVEKMKTDPKVDFQNDWKVITLFISGNDLCKYCKDETEWSPSRFRQRIKDGLDVLHANVPKAFVNLVTAINVTFMRELKEAGFICRNLDGILCPCATYPASEAEFNKLKDVVVQYSAQIHSLAKEYDTRDDFTVVAQPFTERTTPPRIMKNGTSVPDMTYFAPDCFHFSMKGHASAGLALWNNMVEPVGKKRTEWHEGEEIECLTAESPYFYTYKNSNTQKSMNN